MPLDMIRLPDRPLMVVVDGANCYATAKALGFDIDYKKLLKFFINGRAQWGQYVQCRYYTALTSDDQEYSSIRPLVDWLDYNGFIMITKPVKEFTDSFGRRKVKGNMDNELTVDVMRALYKGGIKNFVLFTGDGDFRSMIDAIQDEGGSVVVVSTLQVQPPMVADEMRRSVMFLDMVELQQFVETTEEERQARAQRATRRRRPADESDPS